MADKSFERGVALGLLLAQFLISAVLGAIGLGQFAMWVVIGLAAWLFLKK